MRRGTRFFTEITHSDVVISVNRERAKNAVTSIKCCEMKYNRFCVSPNILRSTNAFLILLNRIGLTERNGETSLKRCVGPYSRPYYTNALGQQQSYREYIVYTHAACIQHPCSQILVCSTDLGIFQLIFQLSYVFFSFRLQLENFLLTFQLIESPLLITRFLLLVIFIHF